MDDGPVPARVRSHVAAFNEAVVSGDWRAFVTRFAQDAVMTFHGVPVPSAAGRDAVRAAYETSPFD